VRIDSLRADATAGNSGVKKYLKNSCHIRFVMYVIDVNNMTERKTGIVATRMTTEELDRFQEIVERAKRRNHLADRASVARELMGFPAVPRTITDEDRQWFITGKVEPAENKQNSLSAHQKEITAKFKEILLHGCAEDPEKDLALAITANVNALWVCLKQAGTTTAKAKMLQKKQKRLPPPPPREKNQRIIDITSDEDIRGERPPPG
jgi:hypothetical protein